MEEVSHWYTFFKLDVISAKRMATNTAKIVFTIINATLYRIVFLVITKASFVANKYLKFLNPTKSDPKIPFFALYFLNASTRPGKGM